MRTAHHRPRGASAYRATKITKSLRTTRLQAKTNYVSSNKPAILTMHVSHTSHGDDGEPRDRLIVVKD